MNEVIRLYSLFVRDDADKNWQIVMSENHSTSFEPQGTLTTIDKRTTDFNTSEEFMKYLKDNCYRVVSTETDHIRLGSSGKSLMIDTLLVTEPNKKQIAPLLVSKKCTLRKLYPEEVNNFMYAFIANRSNSELRRSKVIYGDQKELMSFANKEGRKDKIDVKDPLVQQTINSLMGYASNGKVLRFLLEGESPTYYKYMDSYLYNLIVDYNEGMDCYYKIVDCFSSYKVFRNIYLGIQLYRLKYQVPKNLESPKEKNQQGPKLTEEQSGEFEKILHDQNLTAAERMKALVAITNKDKSAPQEKPPIIEWEQPSFFDSLNNDPTKIIKPE